MCSRNARYIQQHKIIVFGRPSMGNKINKNQQNTTNSKLYTFIRAQTSKFDWNIMNLKMATQEHGEETAQFPLLKCFSANADAPTPCRCLWTRGVAET